LAILSDAAHLLADLASFVVAIAASHIASLPPTSRHTFGFQRLEALAALFSVSSLALISVYLAIEALLRLWPFVKSKIYPESIPSSLDVDAKVMTLVAAMGVAVNIALAFVLKEHHVHLPGMDHGHSHSSHGHGHENEHNHNHNHVDEESALIPTDESIRCDELGHGEKTSKNINLDAAYLHVLGDLCMSFAVLIAGTIIWWKPEWEIADPLCTLFFSFLVFKSTVGVFFSSISVLLNEVPPDLDWDELYLSISSIAGVSDVHDLHVWSISHGVSAMSVHASAEDVNKALMNIHEICQTKFGISHVTVQLKDLTTAKCITCGKGMLLCHN